MYELTTDGLFHQVRVIESTIERPLTTDEIDNLKVIRTDTICIGLELIVLIENGQGRVAEFFDLPIDVQSDIICEFGAEL